MVDPILNILRLLPKVTQDIFVEGRSGYFAGTAVFLIGAVLFADPSHDSKMVKAFESGKRLVCKRAFSDKTKVVSKKWEYIYHKGKRRFVLAGNTDEIDEMYLPSECKAQ